MTETVAHHTVLDTGAEQLGKVYAKALIGAADAAGIADQALQQLGRFVDEYLASSELLATALASPRVDVAEKWRVIDRLLAGDFHPLVVNFLKLMARRGRLGYVDAVRRAADQQRDEILGRIVAEIRSAVPLDDPLRRLVLDRIGESTQRQVRLVETVDPRLIGGVVIRIGDTILDGSVSHQINKLSRSIRSGFSREMLQRFEAFASEA